MPSGRLAVVAFGGNALIRGGEEGTQTEQIENSDRLARRLVAFVEKGFGLLVVHGNGPQVGNILIQVEEAVTKVPPVSLDVCVAQSEGGIGYLLARSLENRLRRRRLQREVVCLVTPVLVDRRDPGFRKPTKPIGPFFEKEKAARLMEELGWPMVEDAGRGWRKVVASPKPLAIRGVEVAAALVNRGHIVIAAGGGGVPVVITEEGEIRGVEAVIDKDYSASMLAAALQADLFVILTGVERVARDYGKPTEEPLSLIRVDAARKLLAEGQFPPGSMGPKIDAAIRYIAAGGHEVLITRAESLGEALEGRTGTRIREKE